VCAEEFQFLFEQQQGGKYDYHPKVISQKARLQNSEQNLSVDIQVNNDLATVIRVDHN